MGLYKLDQKTCELSKESGSKKNSLLKPFHRNNEKFVQCLCNGDDGIPLVTALADGNYYVRAFPSKSKKGIHSRSCIHFVPNEHDFAIRGYNEKAIKLNEEGIYTFSLSSSLLKSKQQSTKNANALTHILKSGISVKTSNTITLLGLFHFMWEQAELNSSKTVYEDINIWTALRKVSWHIQPKNMKNLQYGMSEFLLLPITETDENKKRNFAKLNDAVTKNRHIVFAISLAGHEIIDYGINNADNELGFSLKDCLGVPVKLPDKDSKNILAKFNTSFKQEMNIVLNNDNVNMILIGIAEVNKFKDNETGKDIIYASIKDLAAMAASYGCISVDSTYEKEFTDLLIREQRDFIKPMRYDQDSDLKLLPDFILQDTSLKCLIEVYGMNTQKYIARKEEKEKIYKEIEGTDLSSWKWDVIQTRNLQEWIQKYPLPNIAQYLH